MKRMLRKDITPEDRERLIKSLNRALNHMINDALDTKMWPEKSKSLFLQNAYGSTMASAYKAKHRVFNLLGIKDPSNWYEETKPDHWIKSF